MSVISNQYVASSDATPRELFSLMKPGVMALVVFTGLVGMLMAPGTLHPFLQLITVGCIALGSGAGAMINMWYDRDIDCIMSRTANRPIPLGKVQPDDVLAFGVAMAILAVGLMGLAINWLCAGILAFAIFFYAVIYTMWLKRSTAQNIVIGGAAGAFPPVIGWAAMSDQVTLESLILFAIIFLWTPPHFWALALYKNADYQKANIPMMPVQAGEAHTKRLMLIYSIALFFVSLAPVMVGMSGLFYAIIATLLSGYFIYHAHRVQCSEDMVLARKMFLYSILYLFILFSALLLDIVVTKFYAGFSL